MVDPAADRAAEFADWLTAEGRAANTVAAYRRDVAAYLRWRSAAGLSEANPLATYVAEVRATRKASSAARAVVALRIFHRWQGDEGGAASLPELVGVPIPTEPADTTGLDETEVSRLFRLTRGESAERRRDEVALALLYFGGLKASEAISLDLADIGSDHGVITVDRDGPHERLLPVVPALQEAVGRWFDPRGWPRLNPASSAVLVNKRGQRLTRQGLWLICSNAAKKGGFAQLSPNDLRRACGEHLGLRGVDAAAVAAFLGHSRGGVPSLGMLADAGWGSCNLAV